jgi:hypothetical protein
MALNRSLYIFLFGFLFMFAFDSLSDAQPLRIMPLGNSLTHDDNIADKTNPRPVGVKISYRYRLYQLIKEAGYEFDFVGSENAGNDFFQDEEYDDNAGFGGINDGQMAYLINTGYNQRASQYEAPGPYLLYYPCDVILLHIGTNDIEASASDVEDILDNIRLYDNDVLIFLARIISRQPYPHALTTTFNNNVETMVNARGDNNIVMVNMETGAGINYVTEMADYLHPIQSGYDKMAAKWFQALNNRNTPPDVTTIPEQSTLQGTSFNLLHLDDYVSDIEDTDNQIQWSYKLKSGSKLAAEIDGNRLLHLSVNDINWFGSDTILLKAKDSGNGSFRKTDSVSVKITVIKGNEPPVITSQPITEVNEDAIYNYTITAEDSNPLQYSAIQKPTWLTFSASMHTLTGIPLNSDVGVYPIQLRVSDGDEYVDQIFDLTVNNVNDTPVIISTPITTANTGDSYIYEFIAMDIDPADVLNYSIVSKPGWLTFENGGNKGILTGEPTISNLGANSVILRVSDGHVDVLHGFTITVSDFTPVQDNEADNFIIVYPNTISNKLFIKVNQITDIRIIIYDVSGSIRVDFMSHSADRIEIDVSRLLQGLYIYKAILNDRIFEGKLLKTE